VKRCLFSSVLFAVLFSSVLSYSNELFTKEERIRILNVIDNTCADSWCEGDFDYDFIDFRCKKGSDYCNLTLYLIDDTGKRSSLQTCSFFNITRIVQVLDSKETLNNNFYELLDACLGNLQ
jgi:hypothetical protein